MMREGQDRNHKEVTEGDKNRKYSSTQTRFLPEMFSVVRNSEQCKFYTNATIRQTVFPVTSKQQE